MSDAQQLTPLGAVSQQGAPMGSPQAALTQSPIQLSAPSINHVAIGYLPSRTDLSGGSVSLDQGEELALQAWGVAKDGQIVYGHFLWAISDPSVATLRIDPASVAVIGVKPGSANLLVAVEAWNSKSSLTVSVKSREAQ